ncbi:TonB-dependent receptor domain-containing protein [Flammeovirga kamogawensis]|uniref:TonB-dependent receptor n=1 Tax=Flammeovirga kamogawensis TaxID=373891 RepID=A0ABX8GVZ3_9BACT|nr:TonB-dependent receptor [Flammeovirga kamogawensis]MBB6460992.1 outer membrane receptor protein involved in Fe transport [Flammeovirga kamogawensis]QWG07564.1 TonB-dependent receptor [Flammeovirga kamogawensis]TRX69376.1 TonB-dependent receptor [Flammeovirga kamogawensis]
MKKVIIFLLFFVTGLNTWAQRPSGKGGRPPGQRPKIGTVTGKVIDADAKQPLEFVTVALYSMRDSSFITGASTDVQGRFKITEVPVGKMFAKVTFIGFEENNSAPFTIKPDNKEQFLGNLILSPSAKSLDEVTVTAERDAMEIGIDRKTFNIGQDLTTVGGSMTDALKNIPSIDVDSEGTLSLRGSSNVTIFIDGKPSNLTSSSDADILDQIPASSIERVEVITNPSAKYDPEGTSGIINIVLKKDRKGGVNGNASVTVGNNNKYNASIGVNARISKVNVFANYSGRYQDRYADKTQTQNNFNDQGDFTDYNQQFTHREDNRQSHMLKTGFDFDINDYNNIYFSALFNTGERTKDENLDIHYLLPDDTQIERINRINKTASDDKNQEYNFGYRKTFVNPKQTLDISGQYSDGTRTTDGNYNEYQYVNGTIGSSPILEQRNTNPTNSKIYLGQIDYVQPIGDNGTLETGWKTTGRDIQSDFYSESLAGNGNWTPDDSLNNNFNYQEQIHAFYVMYRHEFGKWGIQGGLRAEQAYTTSHLEDNAVTEEQKVDNNYFALYPTLHIAYKFQEARELSLGYSRRVNRPRGRMLNPFPDYANPQSLRQGNPYLKPEFIDAIEATYQHGWDKVTLTGSLYYRYTHDAMQRVQSARPDGVMVMTWDNVESSQSYGAEAIASYNMTDWWKFSGSANVYNLLISGSSGDLDLSNQAWAMTGKVTSSTNLTKTLSLQVSGRLSSQRATAQGYIAPMGGVDVAVSQKLFKGKGTLQARVTDVFNTYKFNVYSEGIGFNSDMTYDWESRVGYLTFSYRFGKSGNKPRKKGKSGGKPSGGGMDMME